MRRPAEAAHESLGNPPIARVAKQGIALLYARDLVEHVQADANRPQAGLPGGKRVGQCQEVRKSPGMVVIEQQPVTAALLVHPTAKPEDFGPHQDFRPWPQQHPAQSPIDDLNHAIAAAAEHVSATGEVGDGLKEGHTQV
jgi:hypothetical protein